MIPVLAVLVAAPAARADVVTDWNAKAEAIGLEKRLQPPPNARTMAMMHVAMFEAANAAQPRYAPYQLKLLAEPGASPEAAAASAAHGVLVGLFTRPAIQPRHYAQGLTGAGGGRRDAGPRAWRWARRRRPAILALRAKDGITAA